MAKKMYYTEEEAAHRLGISQAELATYVRDGKLRVFPDGIKKMFRVDQVDELDDEGWDRPLNDDGEKGADREAVTELLEAMSSPGFGSENTLVTREEIEAARAERAARKAREAAKGDPADIDSESMTEQNSEPRNDPDDDPDDLDDEGWDRLLNDDGEKGEEKPESDYGKHNTLVTQEELDAARERIRQRRGDANQRARMKQLVKVVVLAVVVAGGIAFLAFGGCSWLSGEPAKKAREAAEQAAKDPLVSQVHSFHACADGSYYMTRYKGRVWWVVGGKAAAVACPDKLMFIGDESLGEWYSDAKGGAYVRGEEHLWYLFKGTATQVKQVPTSEILEDEHRVNNHTVTWSVMQSFGQTAYDKGYAERGDGGDD